MAEAAIVARGLGKRYRRGEANTYRTLRDALAGAARGAFRPRANAANDREFWALSDVDFEIRQGEAVGLVGRNGAGKSTLLKILTRITRPTVGQATLRGRVASLLEVGTGFHPELTGRENVYFNGAILGMRQHEIRAKFEQIVDFAEVGAFVDTPVKHYSSGMYVRLAFAVAAHLEPEILLVDEVLAVGDVGFQEKCLGKMGDVAQSGRTIVFVSHNMAAIQRLCTRAMLLDGGKITATGPCDIVIKSYMSSFSQKAGTTGAALPAVNDDESFKLESFAISQSENHADIMIDAVTWTKIARREIGIGIHLRNSAGATICNVGPKLTRLAVDLPSGRSHWQLRLTEAARVLAPDNYMVDIWFARPGIEYILTVDSVANLALPDRDPYGSGQAYRADLNGSVLLRPKLTVSAHA